MAKWKKLQKGVYRLDSKDFFALVVHTKMFRQDHWTYGVYCEHDSVRGLDSSWRLAYDILGKAEAKDWAKALLIGSQKWMEQA